MKKDEKRPLSWEIADPKLPIVQSGHMENRVEHHRETGEKTEG